MNQLQEKGGPPRGGGGPANASARVKSEASKLPEEKRCQHQFPDGRRCRAARMKGSEWCFFHDPELHQPAPVPALLTANELHVVLARAIEDLRQKRLSAGEAYATGYLVQLLFAQLQKVQEEYSFARGLEELEDAIGEGVEKAAAGALDEVEDGRLE